MASMVHKVDQNDSGFGSNDDVTPKRPNKDCKNESDCSSFAESAKGSNSVKAVLQITIKLFGKLRACESDGKERIVDMIKKKIEETDSCQKAKDTDFLFFKRVSDEAYLNIGAPAGVLHEGVVYECIFKKQIGRRTTDMMRSYNAEMFDKNWAMKSFYVKLSDVTFSVSYFQKFKSIGKVLVDFFPGETLYEALYRDGRFKERTKDGLVICSCDFLTPNDVEISLGDQASNHAQEVLKFKKRKVINSKLDPKVSPLPEPHFQMNDHVMASNMEPVTPLKGDRSNTEYLSTPTSNPLSSTPAPRNHKNLHTLEGLTIYLKEKLGLEIIKQSDEYKEETNKSNEIKEAKKKNDRIFKKHYENFALHYSHRVYLSDLEDTIRLMKHSIGAIIATNVSNVKACGATCFRIGSKYVITNKHVVDKLVDMGIKFDRCYVDFNYEEKGQCGYCFNFASNHVLVSSEELDYAILELNPEGRKLPKSIIDPESGFNIAPPGRQLQAGECLTFIGHPGGLKKQMEVSCPIKHRDEIEEHLVLAFQTLNEKEFQEHRFRVRMAENDPNSALYDVSMFFHGSSGSPGFLMQEKLLVVLHSRGIPYKGNKNYFVVEEGILMASVVKDVMTKINRHEVLGRLGDIFGEFTAKNFDPEEMDIEYE
ncbi:protein FAM111A-like [Actinia tenebrosa]|uniref:Protein FAM111A-like n=1 Tax=Actinia tenebrosa TaxID=6105 RepID=A0A6P8IWI8_ACTTE|nr:protein FAM111A-like [Actinia tenebrosa]XP_031571484.1 protein FAM111A-like [Actinia tenebrosa]